ncbi:MAG: thioredoxin family protein [Anaerolineae bacterium]|nr:thioredoxin family protein [Anaerolineae bacterium]
MPLLKEKDRLHLFEQLKALAHPVTLVVFSQQFEDKACLDAREIAQEVAELAEKVDFQVFEYEANDGLAVQFGVDKIPALAVARGGDEIKDLGIRFYGVPSGYLFTALMHAVMMVGTGESGLSPELKAWAASVREPVRIQVFAARTCLYCPPAVVMAHRLAAESEHIRAEVVEVIEFPYLAVRHNVSSLPLTIINDTYRIEGVESEQDMLTHLQAAVSNLRQA